MRLLLLTLAALALPATTHAATFYVDDDAAAGANPCTSAANPCKTIPAATAQAQGASFPGGDRIQVAPGSYAGQVAFGVAADTGDELAGAGSGSDPATSTILTGPASDDPSLYVVYGNAVRDVRVRRSLAQTAKPVVKVSGFGATLADVAVEVTSTGHTQPAVYADGPLTADHLTVTSAGSGVGLETHAAASLVDSRISGGTFGSGGSGIDMSSGALHVERSVLRSPATALFGTMSVEGGALTIDSSLVLGDTSGVYVHASSAANPASAIVRHTTIDGGAPGADGASNGVRVSVGTGLAHADVSDSIVVDALTATGGGTLRCTSSDVPPSASADIECGADRANGHSDPASLFADLPGGDYRLKAGSPAVDTGALEPLAADESAIDLAGMPRVLDGDLDCAARSDKGAYELTGFACVPPAPVRPPRPSPAALDRTPPVLGKVAVTHRKARVARATTPKGTGFRFTLSETASVEIRLQRLTTGRHRRWVSAGTLPLYAGKRGANTARFSGRVRGHKLRAAKYRATLQATDLAGNRSARRTVTFAIVRR